MLTFGLGKMYNAEKDKINKKIAIANEKQDYEQVEILKKELKKLEEAHRRSMFFA